MKKLTYQKLWISFIIAFIFLFLLQNFVNFRGLQTQQGMENAQIARELARGNGFTTKTIYPFTLALQEKTKNEINLQKFKGTLLQPLYPLVLSPVFKIAQIGNTEKYKMTLNDMIYQPDRIISIFNNFLLLGVFIINFYLIQNLFNRRIAFFSIFSLLFSNLIWKFTQTALPQTLMLLLFSCGIFFYIKALNLLEENDGGDYHPKILPYLLISTAFFSMLVLCHWLALWLFLGFIVISRISFKKTSLFVMQACILLITLSPVFFRNLSINDEFFGGIFYSLIGIGNYEELLRNFETTNAISFRGQYYSFLSTSTKEQISKILENFGGFGIAFMSIPALFYTFHKKINQKIIFQIFLLTIFTAIGMIFYNSSESSVEDGLKFSNLLILFIPLLSAYGFAFCQAFWNTFLEKREYPIFFHKHSFIKDYFVSIIFILIAFLLLFLDISSSFKIKLERKGLALWPPYYAPSISILEEWTNTKSDIIASDQAWAVGWYADRNALLIPKTITDFTESKKVINKAGFSIDGFHITPSSIKWVNKNFLSEEFRLLFTNHIHMYETKRGNLTFVQPDSNTAFILSKYTRTRLLNGISAVYYSKE